MTDKKNRSSSTPESQKTRTKQKGLQVKILSELEKWQGGDSFHRKLTTRRVEVVSYIIKTVTLESIILHSGWWSKNIFQSLIFKQAPTLEFPVPFENPLLKFPLVPHRTCSGDSSLKALLLVCLFFLAKIKVWCFRACSTLILFFPLSIQFLSPDQIITGLKLVKQTLFLLTMVTSLLFHVILFVNIPIEHTIPLGSMGN